MLPLKVRKRYAEARSASLRNHRMFEVFGGPRLRKHEGKILSSRVSRGSLFPLLTSMPSFGKETANIKNRIRVLKRVSKDVRLVEAKLRTLVTPAETRRWIAAPNAMLGRRTPLEAISQGDTGRVLELLIQIEEGIYV